MAMNIDLKIDGNFIEVPNGDVKIEFIDNSGALGRVFTPLAKNLEKLGISARHKVVDFALLQKRLDSFDFELISSRIVGSEAPGAELLERFGSRAAAIETTTRCSFSPAPPPKVTTDTSTEPALMVSSVSAAST